MGKFITNEKKIKQLYTIAIIVLLVAIVSFVFYANDLLYAKVTDYYDKLVEVKEYEVDVDFNNPYHFVYDVTRVKIGKDGAQLIDDNDKQEIITPAAIKLKPDTDIVGFKEDAVKGKGSKITYQITGDYKFWYYHNGKDWVPVAQCKDCGNTAEEIDKNIDDFPLESNGIMLKAILKNGNQPIALNSVEITFKGKEMTEVNDEFRRSHIVKVAQARWTRPECGNGDVEWGEECDDGNNNNNDYCNNQCENQTPICHATGSSEHPFNFLWVGDSAIDGHGANDHTKHPNDIIPITDINDDGEINVEDCNATLSECGNEVQEDGEECDDGNTEDGDGCSSECTLPDSCDETCVQEFGCNNDLTCFESNCRNVECEDEDDCICPYCGDGTQDDGEECDDGNTEDGDGCSSECTTEVVTSCGSEYSCGYKKREICHAPGTPEQDTFCIWKWDVAEHLAHGDYCGACIPECGNLIIEDGEECDDGNTEDGDGCDSECQIEEVDLCTDDVCGHNKRRICHYPGTQWEETKCVHKMWIPWHLGHGDYCGYCEAECGNEIIEEGEECDDGNTEDGDGCDSECQIEEPEEVAVINAYKVVCDSESDLPNWGNGGPNITAGTAPGYVAQSEGRCHLEDGWNFQWNLDQHVLNGDFVGQASAGDGWGTFDSPTSGGGPAQVQLTADDIGNDNKLWFREVLLSGYLPFSAPPGDLQEDNFSAEFYCDTDVINYDNLEWISGLDVGETAYCVGFNVLDEEEWDQSSIEVEVECDGHDAIFTITNVGEPVIGDMAGTSEYRVYRNDTLETTDTFQLDGGESMQVVVSAGADSMRLEADQRPGHPNGDETPQATIENCLIPPDAVDDIASTFFNVDVNINLLDNDSDADGVLIASSTTLTLPPSNGTVTIDEFGVANYNPDNNYTGPDFFSYEVCDDDGLCDTADVNVTVIDPSGPTPIPGVKHPPVADDDSASGGPDTPLLIDVPDNDSDPDGNLDVGSVEVTDPPDNGTTDVDGNTGAVTYTPDAGFVGEDDFIYKICDTHGLCDTAVVTIEIIDDYEPPASPVCGNEVLEDGEECDDGNTVDGDGCSASCTIELPAEVAECGNGIVESGESCDDGNTVDGDGCSAGCVIEEPLVVPVIEIAPPPPAPVVLGFGIFGGQCFDTIYTVPDVTFFGSVGVGPATIAELEYSTNDGLSWNPITAYTAAEGGSNFNFTLFGLEPGEHSVSVRVTYTTGAVFDSIVCDFRVSGDLGFGAIQWVLGNQTSPLATGGAVEFRVGEPEIFYMETEGASYALVRNLDTGDEYTLTYNEDLKLWWSDSIVFTTPGTYQLEGEVGNIFGDVYNRQINTAVVVASPSLSI